MGVGGWEGVKAGSPACPSPPLSRDSVASRSGAWGRHHRARRPASPGRDGPRDLLSPGTRAATVPARQRTPGWPPQRSVVCTPRCRSRPQAEQNERREAVRSAGQHPSKAPRAEPKEAGEEAGQTLGAGRSVALSGVEFAREAVKLGRPEQALRILGGLIEKKGTDGELYIERAAAYVPPTHRVRASLRTRCAAPHRIAPCAPRRAACAARAACTLSPPCSGQRLGAGAALHRRASLIMLARLVSSSCLRTARYASMSLFSKAREDAHTSLYLSEKDPRGHLQKGQAEMRLCDFDGATAGAVKVQYASTGPARASGSKPEWHGSGVVQA